MFDEKQESKQKPDIVPQEFRASLPDVTTSEVKEGTSTAFGSLATDEVSKTIQRITADKIRETKTVRQQGPYAALTDSIVDNDGLVITRVKTVAKGAQTIAPTATISGSVQSLGDGYTLKTQDVKPKVFRGNVFSQEKPDNIPVEFRAQKPATTKEFSEEGDAVQVSLQSDEISKSEQQVTEFVKRTRTTTRDLVGGVTLGGGRQIDEDGVRVTVTRTLAQGSQEVEPSATVRGSVEDIGDGKTIKTELVRDEVFDGQTFSKEKPDNIPVEFRVEKPASVDEKTVEGEVEQPNLEGTDISKSEQQITKFLKRIRTVSRDDVEGVTLEGSQINQEGQVVTVRRSLAKSEQTITPSATLSGNVQNLGGGYTVKTEEEIPKVFRGDVFSQEKPDNVPVEFRAEKPATTKEFSEDGQAAEVTLVDTEISKSEQQVTEFVKRTRTTTRDLVGDVTLGSGRQIDEDGIKVTVTRTLAEGSQEVEPSATVRGSVEDIGDGKTIKTELTRAKVFDGQTYSREKPDNIPVEFRAERPSLVDEKTVEGDAEEPTLEGTELAKSEQQITEFLKRVRTTTRDDVDGVTLEGEEINQAGQKVTIRRTLAKSQQQISPSATLSGNIQALGDGYTVKTEEQLPRVFRGKVFSVERPDPAPEKFRIEIPSKTEQETVAGEAVEQDLVGNELSKSEQQVTEFVKRVSKTTRDVAASATLGGQLLTTELNGGIAQVIETYGDEAPLAAEFGTVSAEKENLGSGKFLIRKVVVNPEIRSGQTYDETFDVTIPFNREIVPAGETDNETPSDIQPRDHLHSVKTTFDKQGAKDNLLQKHIRAAEIVNLSLPNTLVGVELSSSFTLQDIDNVIGEGVSLVVEAKAEIDFEVAPVVRIKNGYSGPARAVKHYFFLPDNACGESAILSKTGASSWPMLKPQSGTIVISVNKTRTSFYYQRSLPNNIVQKKIVDPDVELLTINIPPVIIEEFLIKIPQPLFRSFQVNIQAADKPEPYEGSFPSVLESLVATASTSVITNTFSQSTPSTFLTGVYLYSSSVRPYKYGLVQVEAITVDISPYV